jgi:hypothetical protein
MVAVRLFSRRAAEHRVAAKQFCEPMAATKIARHVRAIFLSDDLRRIGARAISDRHRDEPIRRAVNARNSPRAADISTPAKFPFHA